MTLLRRFTRTPMADRVLVAHAIVVHLAVAGLLRSTGLRGAIACLTRRRGGSISGSTCADVERRIAWAVRTATCLVPLGRTCLTEALTAQHLLRRCGRDATLRLGVARPAAGTLAAHAWLEAADRIVIGGEIAPGYRPLMPKEIA